MQATGLIHETESGQYHVASQYQTTGAPSGAGAGSSGGQGGVSVTSSTSSMDPTPAASINSHLDSWFQTHAMTREDVLVLASVVQLLGWMALLYIEVQR